MHSYAVLKLISEILKVRFRVPCLQVGPEAFLEVQTGHFMEGIIIGIPDYLVSNTGWGFSEGRFQNQVGPLFSMKNICSGMAVFLFFFNQITPKLPQSWCFLSTKESPYFK